MANQYLGLSLFLMLLSFFIILNSMSEFKQDKAAPVLNSLTLAFTPDDEVKLDAGPTEAPAPAEREGSTLDKIQGLFNAQISGLKAKQNRMGTELRLKMNRDAFMAEANSTLAGDGSAFFLDTLVSLIDTQNTARYKMDMVASVAGDDRATRESVAQDMSALAGKLEAAGLPQNMISAGIGEGEAGTVELHFRPFKRFDAKTFEEATRDE
ncbi:MAG: hypothetical protein KTR28_08830 [Micavibrio sp.]|nr:hypothetical protein [Micavibrio sp.]